MTWQPQLQPKLEWVGRDREKVVWVGRQTDKQIFRIGKVWEI
jgi:hypothetical protein